MSLNFMWVMLWEVTMGRRLGDGWYEVNRHGGVAYQK
jgi:hypothetical protein